jgi:hypothetical protein
VRPWSKDPFRRERAHGTPEELKREIMTEVCEGNPAKEICPQTWHRLAHGSHEWNAKRRLGAKSLPHGVALFLRGSPAAYAPLRWGVLYR